MTTTRAETAGERGGGSGRGAAAARARNPRRSAHDQELADRFFELLSILYRHVRVGPLDVWEELELTKSQLRTLVQLAEGPDRMTSIATRLGISLPAATGLIDRLVAKKLVLRERDPEDRRAVICRVAPRGWEALERLHEMGRDEFEDVVDRLTPEELEIVLRGVEILAAIVEALDTSGPESPGDVAASAAGRAARA